MDEKTKKDFVNDAIDEITRGNPNRIPIVHRIPLSPIVNNPRPTKAERKAAEREEAMRAFERSVNKHTVPEIIATAMGLPGRVRNLYKRIDKYVKQGMSHVDILEEIRPIVAKYLTHRMDVAVYSVILLRREVEKYIDPSKIKTEKDVTPEVVRPEVMQALADIKKTMTACCEADALMALRAEYFLIGITVKFCSVIAALEEPIHPAMIGLRSLINMGDETALSRHQRIADGTAALKSLGAELP